MYKQIIFALLLCFSFSFSVKGQVSIYGSTGISSTGINFSADFSQNVIFENESYIQPFLTLGTAIPISNNLYWLGELSFSPSGYKLSNDSITTKIRYNMLNFQTGLGYQLGPLRIEAGGFIGTSLSDQFKNSGEGWSEDFGLTEDFTVGAFAGLNLSITEKIGIFARYYKGLNYISQFYITDFNGEITGSLNEKINNLQFGVTARIF
jgi:hypothetical protein